MGGVDFDLVAPSVQLELGRHTKNQNPTLVYQQMGHLVCTLQSCHDVHSVYSKSNIPSLSVFTKFLTISSHLSKNKFSNEERYSEVKQMAVDYQTSKAQLIEALNQAGCGHWIEKPVEQDQFSISI